MPAMTSNSQFLVSNKLSLASKLQSLGQICTPCKYMSQLSKHYNHIGEKDTCLEQAHTLAKDLLRRHSKTTSE
jgi:hypothetical protein